MCITLKVTDIIRTMELLLIFNNIAKPLFSETLLKDYMNIKHKPTCFWRKKPLPDALPALGHFVLDSSPIITLTLFSGIRSSQALLVRLPLSQGFHLWRNKSIISFPHMEMLHNISIAQLCSVRQQLTHPPTALKGLEAALPLLEK